MANYLGLRVIGKRVINHYSFSRYTRPETIVLVLGAIYTVSIYGQHGSLALSGAGIGTVTEGNPVTFTASSTQLVCTPTGAFTAQIEDGAFATRVIWNDSNIVNDVARNADEIGPVINLQAGQKLGVNEGALIIPFAKLISGATSIPYFDLIKQGSTALANSIRLVTHTPGTGILKVRIYNNGGLTERILAGVNLLSGGIVGLSWGSNELKIFYNGAIVDTTAITMPSSLDFVDYPKGDYEVIYSKLGFIPLKTRPSDANMVISTNF